MQDLYQHLLVGLRYATNTVRNEAEFKKYLQSLQPYVKDLRKSFKQQSIKVDYSNHQTQAAYLIAYYPQYVEMTSLILERLLDYPQVFSGNQLEVCLFGAGPAPEIVALASFCQRNFPDIQSLIIHYYDLAATTWEFSRSITLSDVIPNVWSQNIEVNVQTLDLCQPKAFLSIKNTLQRSKILSFQNCLNELADSHNFFENIYFLIQNLSEDSCLLISDLFLYNNVKTAFAKIEDKIRTLNQNHIQMSGMPLWELRSPSQGDTNFRSALTIPDIILQNLLTGFPYLIPRVNVKCNYLSAVKLPERVLAPAIPSESEQLIEQLRQRIQELEQKLQQTTTQTVELSQALEMQTQGAQQQTENLQIQLRQQAIQSKKELGRLQVFKNEQYVLEQQVKLLRIAVMISGTIGFLGFLLGLLSLLR